MKKISLKNIFPTKFPAGNINSNNYDKLNRLTSSTSQISGVQRVSSFAYDLNGNQITSTNWLGNTQTNVYDALNRLVERIDADGISTQKLEYNLDDAQIKSIDAMNQVTTFKYDLNGRKVETINAEGNSERIDYDVLGNVIGKSDGLGNKTRYDYDASNRLKAVVNALGESTLYTYDNNGNILSQTDGNGHTTLYKYNDRNLLYMSMEPMASVDYDNVTGYIYDYNGNLILTGKEYGNLILSDYDILNRLTHKKSGKVSERDIVEGEKFPIDVMESIDYSYDPNGNLLTMQDATGLTTWTYDEAGRALTKTVTGIGLSTYAYDLTSGIDSLEPGYCAEQTTDPLGGITLKVYDKVDRLAQVTDAGETTQFEYYADGNRKSVTYPDGSKEVYAYNKIGQNTSLINLKADGTVIDTYSYTYDAAGNQTTKTDAKGTTTFTYDKLNRLAEVTEPSGIKTTYSFDKAGNRLSEKKYAGATLLQDTSYTYDLANRLTQTQTKMNTTSETEKTLYSYDAAGNTISQSKTTIKPAAIGGQATFVLEKGKASADLVTLYAYDGFNQLKQSDDGINKITYAYNGFGLRTEKSAKANGNQTATVTKYLYEGEKIILELDGSGNKIAKNTFGTNLLSREMAETKVYYMYNGHGDVTALLSEAGAIVGTYYYDVWGNILEKNESEQITNPYRYAGYQYDDETGLYYLNARYYDAKIARFLTEDTVTGDRNDPLSLNRYSYCYNNPIVYDDPTGNVALNLYEADGNVRVNTQTGSAKNSSVTGKNDKNNLITADSTKNKNEAAKEKAAKELATKYNAAKAQAQKEKNTDKVDLKSSTLKVVKGIKTGIDAGLDILSSMSSGISAGTMEGVSFGASTLLDSYYPRTNETAYLVGKVLGNINVAIVSAEACAASSFGAVATAPAGGTVALAPVVTATAVSTATSVGLAYKNVLTLFESESGNKVLNNKGVPYPEVDVNGYGKVELPSGPYEPNNSKSLRAQFTDSFKKQFKEWWTKQGRPWPEGEVNIHHIKPLSKGGDNSFENLVPLIQPVEHQPFTNWWRNFP